MDSMNPDEPRPPEVYRLRDGCQFFRYDGRSDKEEYVVSTPENRHFRISKTAKEVLQRFDGETAIDDIARGLSRESVEMPISEFCDLLTSRYVSLGILERPNLVDSAAPELVPRPSIAKAALFYHWQLIPRSWVRRIARPLVIFYARAAAAIGVLFILATHVLLYIYPNNSTAVSSRGSLLVLILCLLSVMWHEFGHAAALSRFGGDPGPIGFGLYVLLPTFFADVSEVWRFRRRQRMVVDLGGVYFQELYFGIAAVLSLFTLTPELRAVCHFVDLMVVINLNPVLRFDGYWFMVDWLGLPNLYRIAVAYIGYLIRKLFGKGGSVYALPAMSRPAYVVFVVYASICNFFFVYVFWLSYQYLKNTYTRLPSLLVNLFASLMLAVREGDVALFVNRIIVLFFAIAFPATAALGLYRYANFLSRTIARKIGARKIGAGNLALAPGPQPVHPLASNPSEKGEVA